jgi:phosphohistidine phosphatase SixA
MKTLLVLRHAKSSWSDPARDDHERPLNTRGRRDAPRMGALVRKHGLIPDVVISSDAVRARLTAESVVEAARMQMSHIYQPVMLEVLLTRGGRAPIRTIATAILAHDESQIDYYTEIVKQMPGRVGMGSSGDTVPTMPSLMTSATSRRPSAMIW